MAKQKYIKNLGEIGKKDFSFVGGKGSNLGEMINAGLPVPDGFVILTSAYGRYVDENNLQNKIDKILRRLNSYDFETLEEVSRTIQEWFNESMIPEDVKQEISHAYKKLNSETVAVRSSATAEDLPGSSFAGQYDTYLNIKGIENVYESVKKCFASLWNSRAMSYRLKQGISHDEIAHAVVIQRLINGEKSGILFTVNPLNNRSDQMVINASWGLGEAIVSGEVSPDQWIVDKNIGRIIKKEISTKQVMTIKDKNGAITTKVPTELQNKPSLHDKDIRKLIELGRKTELYFNSPQDIEWIIVKDKAYILQSRDITTLRDKKITNDNYEWNFSYKGDYLWTYNIVGDVFPEVMTPSTWSVWKYAMGKEYGGHPSMGNIGGRIYANYSLIYSMIRSFGKNHEQAVKLIETLLSSLPVNIDVSVIPLSKKTIILEIIPLHIKLAWKQRKLKKNYASILSGVPETCQKLQEQIKKVRDKKELISVWNKEIMPLFIKLYYLQDKFNNDFFMPYADFKVELEKLIGEENANILQSYISGGSEELASIGPLLGLTKVVNGEMSRNEYLKLYGHRHFNENELSVPRPVEDIDWLDKKLAESKQTTVNVKETLKNRSDEFNHIWKKVEDDYPRKAKSLIGKLNRIRKAMHIRENVRSELTRSVGLIRHFFLRAGELTGLGEDIFFLTYQEVLNVLSEDVSSIKNIAPRKKKYAEYKNLPPYPQFIKGEFDPFEWAANPKRRSDIFAPGVSDFTTNEEDVIKGYAASAGQVEGIVRRLDSPDEGALLKSGEILVTATTNIGWTPLFSKASAVVTDVGAQLSHAAIVAREMGIPAVVGTGNATMYLKTGDRIMVDGAKGIVKILRD